MTYILKSTLPIFVIFLALISINAYGETCQTICQNQISTCATSASEQRQRLLSDADQWADKGMWREAVDHFGSMTPEKCAAANSNCPAKCEAKLARKEAKKADKQKALEFAKQDTRDFSQKSVREAYRNELKAYLKSGTR